MTWEQTDQSKSGRPKRPRSKAKSPKKTPAEKAVAAAEKERVRLEKAEVQRKAKEDKQRAAEAKKERIAARATDPVLFLEALKKSRSSHNQLVALTEIAKKVDASVKTLFTAYWKQAISAGALPAGVSSLKVGTAKSSTRKVFLLTDLSPSVQSVGAGEAGTRTTGLDSARVKERMLSEFDRLNEAGGMRFYVSLFDLRRALPEVGRDDFDSVLNELRKEWVLTLSAAEGLHETVPAHILDAGILEQSRRLVYVARREA